MTGQRNPTTISSTGVVSDKRAGDGFVQPLSVCGSSRLLPRRSTRRCEHRARTRHLHAEKSLLISFVIGHVSVSLGSKITQLCARLEEEEEGLLITTVCRQRDWVNSYQSTSRKPSK